MEDDESVVSSPRRPLPSLPPLSSTQKPKSLRPLPMGPSALGDLSDMESSHQSQSRRKRRRRKTAREESVRRSSENESESRTPRTRRQQAQVPEEYNDAEHTEDGERERSVPAASARTRRRKKTKSSGSFHNKPRRYDGEKDMEVDDGKSFVLSTLVPEEDRVKNDEANADNKIREMRSVQPDNDKAVFSEKRNDIYIQTRTGFKRQNTERWSEKRRDVEAQQQRQQDANEMDIEIGKRRNMTVQMALNFIKAFDHITFIFHSLLAGIAIWQIFYVMVLHSKGLNNFFVQYESIALPIHLIYQVALTLCFMSALDRFDFQEYGLLIFRELCKANSKAWMVLAYLVAIVLEYSTVGINTWMATNNPTTPQNETNPFWNQTLNSNYLNDDPESQYNTWLIVNIVKTVAIVFGWLLIAADPSGNNTAKNIFSSPDDEDVA